MARPPTIDPFSWLPLSDRKGLPTPRVLLRDLCNVGGFFAPRTKERCIDEEFGFDRRESDHIVLSTHWGEPMGSTVAHEHRHFQQHYRLLLPQLGKVLPVDFGETQEDWVKGIHQFYTSQPWEMDALRYSMRVHRDVYAEAHYEDVQAGARILSLISNSDH